MPEMTDVMKAQKRSLDADAKRMGGAEFAIHIANVVQATVVNDVVQKLALAGHHDAARFVQMIYGRSQ